MALSPLATAADLSTRGVDVSDTEKVSAMLDAASSVIREAAGCTITKETSTVTLPGTDDEWLDLPGLVRSVTSVAVDGTTVTDWVLSGNRLWRYGGWRVLLLNQQSFFLPSDRYRPVNVDVTYTHGLDVVPADIVQLACDLAQAGLLSDQPRDPRVANEGEDDYRVGYVVGPDAVASVFELPERTKAWLRQRFSAQAFTTGTR